MATIFKISRKQGRRSLVARDLQPGICNSSKNEVLIDLRNNTAPHIYAVHVDRKEIFRAMMAQTVVEIGTRITPEEWGKWVRISRKAFDL